MEYIQKLFLSVQGYTQENPGLERVIAFLDAEPPEFRSVGYEAASMELALQDLSGGMELNNWKKFYVHSAKAHAFHMEIGLGWAFAKTEITPTPFLKTLQPAGWMVFDGMGYYFGLFKGRRTVKNQLVPEVLSGNDRCGFDQGLGRRLWYISKGEVNELNKLMQPFHLSRHAALWCGVGIACGYVGGSQPPNLERLLHCSGDFNVQLRTGVGLAAISRNASNSITRDIDVACKIICGKTLKDVLTDETALSKHLLVSHF